MYQTKVETIQQDIEALDEGSDFEHEAEEQVEGRSRLKKVFLGVTAVALGSAFLYAFFGRKDDVSSKDSPLKPASIKTSGGVSVGKAGGLQKAKTSQAASKAASAMFSPKIRIGLAVLSVISILAILAFTMRTNDKPIDEDKPVGNNNTVDDVKTVGDNKTIGDVRQVGEVDLVESEPSLLSQYWWGIPLLIVVAVGGYFVLNRSSKKPIEAVEASKGSAKDDTATEVPVEPKKIPEVVPKQKTVKFDFNNVKLSIELDESKSLNDHKEKIKNLFKLKDSNFIFSKNRINGGLCFATNFDSEFDKSTVGNINGDVYIIRVIYVSGSDQYIHDITGCEKVGSAVSKVLNSDEVVLFDEGLQKMYRRNDETKIPAEFYSRTYKVISSPFKEFKIKNKTIELDFSDCKTVNDVQQRTLEHLRKPNVNLYVCGIDVVVTSNGNEVTADLPKDGKWDVELSRILKCKKKKNVLGNVLSLATKKFDIGNENFPDEIVDIECINLSSYYDISRAIPQKFNENVKLYRKDGTVLKLGDPIDTNLYSSKDSHQLEYEIV